VDDIESLIAVRLPAGACRRRTHVKKFSGSKPPTV
jgi:hypothetical protein